MLGISQIMDMRIQAQYALVYMQCALSLIFSVFVIHISCVFKTL